MAASQDWKQLPRRSTSEQEAICRVDVIESKLQAKKNGRALILVPGNFRMRQEFGSERQDTLWAIFVHSLSGTKSCEPRYGLDQGAGVLKMRRTFPMRALHHLFSRRLLVAALQKALQAGARTKKSRRRSEPGALERRSTVACTESHCHCPRYVTPRLATAV
jgi:hypothetical protein